MSPGKFASVLFEAKMISLNVFAKPIICSIWTSLLDIFLSPYTFFLTSYFFSLKNCWNMNCDIWSSYVGDRSDTSPLFEHPNNTATAFLFICRTSKIIVSGWWNLITKSLCGLKANSIHCLDLTFIQNTNLHYLDGPQSVMCIV